jgi:protein-disulfide isomerase-like protein with CxxC motif
VLDDNTGMLANRWGVSGIPSYTLIGRDMAYVIVNGYPSPSQIEAALDEPVPEVE